MGNICSCYIKSTDEEIIKDPKELAKIAQREFIEYQKTMKPRKHQALYMLNKKDL